MPGQPDRKGQRLDDKIAARRFDDEDVRAVLDGMEIDDLIRNLGEPERITRYAEQLNWKPGQGRPMFADDDPAVMQAIGRCAANRIHHGAAATVRLGPIHPGQCGFCDYPLDQLLEACAWAVMASRYVVADLLIWRNDGQTYIRPSGATGYQAPAWASFFALPAVDRAGRIATAAGRSVAA